MIRLDVIGNVGTDVEMRYTPQGTPVSEFRLAANRRYKDSEGSEQQSTEWLSVVCWQKLAEIVNEHVKKGDKLYCSGRMQTHSWVGNDGQTRFRVELVCRDLEFLTPKGAGAPERDEVADGVF